MRTLNRGNWSTSVAMGPQITKPPIRKIDNLYEKRTNPLGRLFTTLLDCKSRNLFAHCWMRLTAITTLEQKGDEEGVNVISLRSPVLELARLRVAPYKTPNIVRVYRTMQDKGCPRYENAGAFYGDQNHT
jgi:hypothetical protein